jgi:glycopeptide antibiotics resistance protein
VPKWVTLALLVAITLLIIALLWMLAGRAYATESDAILFLFSGSLTADRRIAIVMPLLADLLLFMPWGFLLFMTLDGTARPRRTTYTITITASIIFAAALQIAQFLLPSRVTTPIDLLTNAVGGCIGAVLAQLRKDVRVQFEC